MHGPAKGKQFKMKGHTLPGINQRSEGDTDLPDGRSKSSALQHKPWAEEHKEKVAHSGTKEAHGASAAKFDAAMIKPIMEMVGGMKKNNDDDSPGKAGIKHLTLKERA